MFGDINAKLNDKAFVETAVENTASAEVAAWLKGGDCDCIEFAKTPANCGQTYNYKGK